jgi:hypothetical protein
MGAASLFVACGGRSLAGDIDDVGDGVPRCVPGEEAACSCSSGQEGSQVCGRDGTFGRCQCAGGGSSGRGGSGTSGTSAGGSQTNGGSSSRGGNDSGGTGATGVGGTGGGEAGASSGPVLSSGDSVLVDGFVGERGVYVVLADAIVLVGRDGAEIARVVAPREITSAAFDGSRLVVADRARLTTYDSGLEELASGDLVETCASSVLVGGGRFVCGPSNDWDRVFYTYDIETGALLASSNTYTYNGIPMRRVPGTDDFVTVTVDSSPSDFHLYSVVESGEPVFVNESPYHGDFGVTSVYAFNANPATHLITHGGLMLHIYGDGCTAGSSFSSECFVKDGDLGTLTGAQSFAAMENGSDGKLYGVVATNQSYFDPICPENCLLQRIDVATRTVEAQSVIALGAGAIVALRMDPISGSVVVGYELSGRRFYDDPYPGYRVVLISF